MFGARVAPHGARGGGHRFDLGARTDMQRDRNTMHLHGGGQPRGGETGGDGLCSAHAALMEDVPMALGNGTEPAL